MDFSSEILIETYHYISLLLALFEKIFSLSTPTSPVLYVPLLFNLYS